MQHILSERENMLQHNYRQVSKHFKCDVCKFKFTSKVTLESHISNVHEQGEHKSEDKYNNENMNEKSDKDNGSSLKVLQMKLDKEAKEHITTKKAYKLLENEYKECAIELMKV